MKTGIIDEIKSRVSCIEYMRTEHNSNIVGGRCVSFRPGADNPSAMMVNERDWWDFVADRGGDVIDLAAADKFNGNIGMAIAYLAERWNIEDASSKLI